MPIVCASTFSRPRCAIPITTSCAPADGGELERLVEHRDQDVEPLERELLLAEERAAQVALHALDLAEPGVEPALLLGVERRPEAPRLDRLAQPDALLVVADVLDLVADRAAVGLLEARQRLGERLAGDVDAQDRGRDARLQLGRQLRLESERVERRVADRLGAERVEPRREVAVHPVGLDERHRGGDAAEQLGAVDARLGAGRQARRARRQPGAAATAVAAPPSPVGQAASSSRAIPGRSRTTAESPFSNSARHSGGTASGLSRYSSRSRRA